MHYKHCIPVKIKHIMCDSCTSSLNKRSKVLKKHVSIRCRVCYSYQGCYVASIICGLLFKKQLSSERGSFHSSQCPCLTRKCRFSYFSLKRLIHDICTINKLSGHWKSTLKCNLLTYAILFFLQHDLSWSSIKNLWHDFGDVFSL